MTIVDDRYHGGGDCYGPALPPWNDVYQELENSATGSISQNQISRACSAIGQIDPVHVKPERAASPSGGLALAIA